MSGTAVQGLLNKVRRPIPFRISRTLRMPLAEWLKSPKEEPSMIPVRTLALVLSIMGLAVPAWADFQAGRDAHNSGDYATAMRKWRPLAEQRDAEAQDFIGTLYFEGWGVPQDYA